MKIDDLRVRLANAMAKDNLAASVYPHQRRLPVMIGEMNPAERNGILASLTGFPAITSTALIRGAPRDQLPILCPQGRG